MAAQCIVYYKLIDMHSLSIKARRNMIEFNN